MIVLDTIKYIYNSQSDIYELYSWIPFFYFFYKIQLVYFNAVTTPNMAISKGIRISRSIPIIFEPVEYDGHLFVDGGLGRRLPVVRELVCVVCCLLLFVGCLLF